MVGTTCSAKFIGNLRPSGRRGAPLGLSPQPALPTPSSAVLQVPVDGPEAETEAEEPPGSLPKV